MKKLINIFFILLSFSLFAQYNGLKKKGLPVGKTLPKQAKKQKTEENLTVINENVPLLIPQKKSEKFGYINQSGQFIIKPEYHIAMFFAEDCNLANSANQKVRKFGSSEYATVEKNKTTYRIDKSGKRVYQYKDSDLAVCRNEFKKQLFHAYIIKGLYGVVEDAVFKNPSDPKQFKIYPEYEYLYIMEGNELTYPMIVVTRKDKFGVIDINNKIIIPFDYDDIKRNYSWKLGRMFEVTKDGTNYYYIDANNHAY